MMFTSLGHPIAQETIVRQAFGTNACGSALPSVISDVLSSQWTDINNNNFTSKLTASYDFQDNIIDIDNSIIVNELSNNRPLLYANTHHAMVLVSFDYVQTPNGVIQPLRVGVLDPWPYNQGFHYLSPAEMVPAHMGGQYSFLASVSID
jgi:hypothetical protein